MIAKEQDEGGQQSDDWTVTVQPVQTEKPEITSVKDTTGGDVPHESITTATELDLTIKAGNLELLRILVNGDKKYEGAASPEGVLHYRLAGLELGDQDITVMGVVSGLVSKIHNVFVVPGLSDGKLAIIAAKDAQGNQILAGGATTATTLTFTGTAKANATGTLFDVFTVLGTFVADPNGYWRLTLSDLGIHYYHLALSADDAEPPMLWWVAVFAAGTPIIVRATDLAGMTIIPPDGETSGQAFTVGGVGLANETLTLHELLSDVKASVTCDADGKWQYTKHATAEPREYHFVASKQGEGSPKSNLYRVRKVAPPK